MSLLGLAVHHDDAGMDASVLWLGAGDVPHAIATSLLTRGVRIAESGPHVSPPGRLTQVLPAQPRAKGTPPDLSGRRVLVLHSDAEHANLLSWAISARGALTRTFDASALDAMAAFESWIREAAGEG